MSDVFQSSDAIRRSACRLHTAVRDAMREVLRLASGVRGGNRADVIDLCCALEKLAAAVRKHNIEEHLVLDPFLAQVDAWGAERIKRIVEERDAERRVVSAKPATLDATELVRTAYGLVYQLLRLLRKEERESFSRDVLRSDWISIEQEDG